MDYKDITGEPRSIREIEAALKFIEADRLRNPLRMFDDYETALIHYTVIRDVLREVLSDSIRRGCIR